MTDPFDMTTSRQRAFVLAAIVTYFALFAYDLAVGSARAAALSDLVILALALPAGILVIYRATSGDDVDWIALLAAIAFLVAGLAIGYSGLAALTDLPAMPIVESAGSVSLLIALVLYLYRSYQ